MTLARTFLALSRPNGLFYLLVLVATGFGWAHWDRAFTLRGEWPFLCVLVAFCFLHAGTMWLNAAFDRDTGDVLWGRRVPVPPGTWQLGVASLVVAGTIGVAADPLAGAGTVLCAVLAVVYSHPKLAWKRHAVLGPIVNALGYGLLAPFVGFSVVHVSATTRTFIAWGLGASCVLACYFAAQAFQGEEDRARGYRTLVVTHGPAATLFAARACLFVSFAGATALALAGWVPRVCLVAAPLWVWLDSYVRKWAVLANGGDVRWAGGFVRRLLLASVVILVVTSAEYARASLAGEPVAGLGTVAGHPHDRPVLPPRILRALEIPRSSPTRPTALANSVRTSIDQFHAELAPNSRVVDVRSPEEFATGHVPGSLNIPFDALNPFAPPVAGFPNHQAIYVISAADDRATKAATALAAAGFEVREVVGGMDVWRTRGFPIE